MRLGLSDVSEERIRSDVDTSSAEVSEEVVMDVTGQGRVSAEESMMVLEPRLENVNVVTILDPGNSDPVERTDIVENSSGERPSEFYNDYFDESAGVIMSRIRPEGLQKCVEEAEYVENAIRRAPEFHHGQTRFGIGIENNFIRSEGIDEALEKLDQELGFQIIFSYTGDSQASEQFQEYMENNQLFEGTVDEGVTGIVSLGRSHIPQVYMAGPQGLEVDMPEFPGYTDNLETRHVYDLV